MVPKTRKIYFTRAELVDMADELGYELKLTSLRLMQLYKKDDPDCWGTVTDLSTDLPVIGFRHYTIEGWKRALPDNIQRIEEMIAKQRQLGEG